MAKDQKRAVNFTDKEESCLISLVKKYSNVVECKQSDTQTNRQKAEYWKIIEKEFNSVTGECYRNEKVLKKKYDNLKKRSKKKIADEKAYSFGTGGGPEKKIKLTDTDMEIQEILGTRINGNFSEFDSDVATAAEESVITDVQDLVELEDQNDGVVCTHEIDHNFDKVVEENTTSCSKTEEVACSSSNHEAKQKQDWSKYTPKMLRTKKSRGLTRQSDGNSKRYQSDVNISKTVSQWAQAKEAIELSRRDFLQKEAEFKLQALKEKHLLEMDIMKKKSEFELELMQKEHEARMEVIQLSVY